MDVAGPEPPCPGACVGAFDDPALLHGEVEDR